MIAATTHVLIVIMRGRAKVTAGKGLGIMNYEL